MDKIKYIFTIERKMEKLREKLNKDIVRNLEYKGKEGYESLLATSRELDDVIVDYIKSVNK
ncbi:sporulation protein Spo0E [Clostridium beijerinckii]|uniref:sporulation protein Spo0E n=1 Tax=Clostridium beijerinckii TaxID=1520 RepID=UPI001801D4DA|nr:sporulation protein Spo0E [Clostridium beijerinckii]NOW06671.1 hypothetical protein [Clostridium beijerinckii]NYC00185.1 hypothetical protein [Clostridium beijerinckii]